MAELLARPERDLELDFDQVYEEHFAFVWRSLRYLGIPPAQLDDAAQDVFVVVHRRLEGFAGRSSLKTWLFGIAHMVAIALLRRERRKRNHQPLPTELPSPLQGPDGRLESAEAARWLDAFLDTLDDNKRAAFILAELEQMTAPEISEALGVKLNTVYSRLRAARQALEHALILRGTP
jgi:RNA polymerase sigma-70 factor (ECF subfamily)